MYEVKTYHGDKTLLTLINLTLDDAREIYRKTLKTLPAGHSITMMEGDKVIKTQGSKKI